MRKYSTQVPSYYTKQESIHETLRQAESFKLPPVQSKDQYIWKSDYWAHGAMETPPVTSWHMNTSATSWYRIPSVSSEEMGNREVENLISKTNHDKTQS